MVPIVALGIAYTAVAYWLDVVVRPAAVAAEARRYARGVGKRVLNVGAGTPGSSLRVVLLGPTRFGDVNCDLAAGQAQPCGPEHVCYCDGARLPYADKTFGALVASHVLEHMQDPVGAINEWERVADRVYVVVPKWWAPHTWLHPGHRWYFPEDGAPARPLWS
jgi:ubiquinone/menaquinone biosynthesis C-methylase UbiE